MSIEIKPWTIIGYRKNGSPIYNIAGGAVEGIEDGNDDVPEPDAKDEVDDTDADELEDEDDDDEEPVEPRSRSKKSSDRTYTKEDVDKAIKRRQAALKKARELEKELRELRSKNETETERARREASEEAAAAAAQKYKPALVKKHAEKGLLEAGVKPGKINRLIKLMDMEEIDVDEDLNIEGVDEQIEVLQEEYPELFNNFDGADEEPKPKRRTAPRVESSDRKPPKREKSMEERLMDDIRKKLAS